MGAFCFNCFKQKGEYEVCMHCGHIVGTPNEPAYMLQPGTQLEGRYIIGTILGVGGFGVTYKAWDARLAIVVAIKEFFPQTLVSRTPGEKKLLVFTGEKMEAFMEQKARFMKEGRNLAKFANDPHIVNVLDTFSDNGTSYIVMGYLDGITLKEYIAQQGGILSSEESRRIMGGVLKGLQSIHAQGIIHRDISPDNIHVLANGRIKILDFGAAKFVDGDDEKENIVIKKGYAPPEQYRNNMKQSTRTDIYAAGATWYKMLTGITPEESIERWEKDELERPSRTSEYIDTQYDKSIMKAMSLKPDSRFQDAKEMLEAADGNIEFQFADEGNQKKRKNTWIAVGVLLGVFLIIMGMVAMIDGQSLENQEVYGDTITLWITQEESRTGMYDTLVQEFYAEYPEHSIEIVVLDEEEIEEGVLPTMTTSYIESMELADLSPLVQSLELSDYYLLKDELNGELTDANGDVLWLPIGWNTTVLYFARYNTMRTYYDNSSDSTALTTDDASAEYVNELTSLDLIWGMYEEMPEKFRTDVYDMLDLMSLYLPEVYDEESVSWDFSEWEEDLTSYMEINAAYEACVLEDKEDTRWMIIGGVSQMEYENAAITYGDDMAVFPVLVNEDELNVEFVSGFYVNEDATENQKLVAMQFINFVLSEKGQTICHLDYGTGFPLYKDLMTNYLTDKTQLYTVTNATDSYNVSYSDLPEEFTYFCWNWLNVYSAYYTENYDVETYVDAFMEAIYNFADDEVEVVTIPNVTGLSYFEALEEIEAAGLVAEIQYYFGDPDHQAGEVIEQSVGAICTGSTVLITYDAGNPMYAIEQGVYPDITQMDKEAAMLILNEAIFQDNKEPGFVYESESYTYVNGVEQDVILNISSGEDSSSYQVEVGASEADGYNPYGVVQTISTDVESNLRLIIGSVDWQTGVTDQSHNIGIYISTDEGASWKSIMDEKTTSFSSVYGENRLFYLDINFAYHYLKDDEEYEDLPALIKVVRTTASGESIDTYIYPYERVFSVSIYNEVSVTRVED